MIKKNTLNGVINLFIPLIKRLTNKLFESCSAYSSSFNIYLISLNDSFNNGFILPFIFSLKQLRIHF